MCDVMYHYVRKRLSMRQIYRWAAHECIYLGPISAYIRRRTTASVVSKRIGLWLAVDVLNWKELVNWSTRRKFL